MKDSYSSEKEALYKTHKRVMLIPLIVFIFLVTIFARLAIRPGVDSGLLSFLPSGDAAYEIAKDYIRPSFRSSGYRFATDYELTKSSDSVYVLNSFYRSRKNGEEVTTRFKIRLKYEGGNVESLQNWSELNFDEQ